MKSESNFGAGDYLIITNEIRLAGCSVVALMMMSIPGLTHQMVNGNAQPTLDRPVPAPVQPTLGLAHSKEKLSLFRRMTHVGNASWYGTMFDGRKTASGETFDMNQMTACHRTLPFGTMVKVIDIHSGKSVIVKINDRGTLLADRIIDLSLGAAERLGIRQQGIASVRLEVLNKKQAARAVEEELAWMSAPDVSSAQPNQGAN